MPVPPMTIPPGMKNNFGSITTGGKTHQGLDIPPVGGNDAVVSPEKAVVVDLWTNDLSPPFVGYGPAGVLLRGDSGVFHVLAHLDTAVLIEQGVAKGQRFDEGEQVSLISRQGPKGGGTPTPTWKAPHVHWEVRRDPFKGPTVDPIAFLEGRLVNTSSFEWWHFVLIGVALHYATKHRR